ncbi:MAG: HAD hydrolase family protein [Bryobacterales bacterium]|nr:HAD hydrolase family protein [Bryobacterales bacterium]
MQFPTDALRRAAKVKLLLMDVDGVLTDGKLYNLPGPSGDMVETKAFSAQDGIGLRWLAWHGFKTGVISGRVSPATVERATQVEMAYIYQGHVEKVPILNEILAKEQIAADQVCFVGDDLTDAILMRRVGLGVAVANARHEVKQVAHYVTTSPGGEAAVREVCELLLTGHGLWQAVLEKYEIPLQG